VCILLGVFICIWYWDELRFCPIEFAALLQFNKLQPSLKRSFTKALRGDMEVVQSGMSADEHVSPASVTFDGR